MKRWSEAEVGFRPLVAADLPLLHDWLGREHVRAWWGNSGTPAQVEAEYLPAIEGRDPTDLYAIIVGERPVGLVQTYLIADYPEWDALIESGPGAAGIDIFLGEASDVGSGLGTYVIRIFVRVVVFARADTTICVADVDVRNLASLRAFEKAGFTRVGEFVDPDDGQLHALVRLDRG
jgi:RimJ/RimL family protein N-acetyltransferase